MACRTRQAQEAFSPEAEKRYNSPAVDEAASSCNPRNTQR
jgi:hypothetical protein